MRDGALAATWSALALGAALAAGLTTPTTMLAVGDEVRSISAGNHHTCAVKADGSAWCWGFDYFGQLGDSSTGDAQNLRLTPVQVKQGSGYLTGVRAISAGDDNSCAVKTNGTAWCWGWGQFGVPGDGTTQDRHKAVKVKSSLGGYLSGITAVSVGGGDSACARKNDGTVWCWGRAADGEVGDGTTGDAQGNRLTAVQVRRATAPLTGITQISSGLGHSSCARRSDGTAWCWGDDVYGELGDGTTGNADGVRLYAVRVKQPSGGMTGVRSVSEGDYHGCGLKTNGTVWCWGYDGDGELGDGTTGNPTTHTRLSPVTVRQGSGSLTGITAVSAGGDGSDHSCARRSDATTWCWGDDVYGELGDGTTGGVNHDRTKAVEVVRNVAAFAGVSSVDTGGTHTCAVRTNSTAWCWGHDEYGELGNEAADTNPHATPIRVAFP